MFCTTVFAVLLVSGFCHALPAKRVFSFDATNLAHFHGLVIGPDLKFHLYYGLGDGSCSRIDPTAPWLHVSRPLSDPRWAQEQEMITRDYLESNQLMVEHPGSIGPAETDAQRLISIIAKKKSNNKATAVFLRTEDYANSTAASLTHIGVRADNDFLASLDMGYLSPFSLDGQAYLLMEHPPAGENQRSDNVVRELTIMPDHTAQLGGLYSMFHTGGHVSRGTQICFSPDR